MSRGDKHDSRYFDSQWHSGWIERDTKPCREPRARFAGAILLLWVVAFAAVCLVWEVVAK
jgi:hypothetical protein